MRSFLKVAEGVDTLPLLLALRRQPELWGQNGERKYADGSPHGAMSDIWVRFNDRAAFDSGERPWSEFTAEHESVWYPAAAKLPEVRDIVFPLMARVQGERLGGILITKLAPGGQIDFHVDSGWHAGYYDKYFVALQSADGALFSFAGEDPQHCDHMHARTGDIHWFRNDIPHGVFNRSDDDRIAMIVCIKHSKP